ncbi:MAG TPA: GxxExxY protein [Geobacteraceae bacterium]|nr:GxxExxY protein [Geobacteraceae bacterium]
MHSALGPGLLESAYQVCLAHELREEGHEVVCEMTLPVVYRGLALDAGYRIDMLVNNALSSKTKQWKGCCRSMKRNS